MKGESLHFDSEDLKSLTDAAYERLRRAIVEGQLAPGSRISERVLADKMGVSTTTVKRALSRLSVEGLVEIRPRRGTYVQDSLSDNMRENTRIRAHLEGLAARFAAEKATDKDLKALRKQLDLMSQATEDRMVEDIVRTNGEFHRLLQKTGGNPYLIRMIDVVKSFDARFRNDSHRSDPEESLRGLQEHQGVFRAVELRDPELAEQLMREHILRTLRFFMKDEAD